LAKQGQRLQTGRIDVHQHLWPEPFIAALRCRRRVPRLDGWTLLLAGERPWEIDPWHHDVEARAAQAAAEGHDLVLVGPSACLGIDRLPPREARELARAWLDGALELPAPFRAWATAGVASPEPDAVQEALDRGAVGLEIAADILAAPGGVERLRPLLEVLERSGHPVLVHPGPAGAEDAPGRPRWWAPVVTCTAQLQAAWWAWAHAGRPALPGLRVCFAALAGLGPLHHERRHARGGAELAVDQQTFVETSSYRTQAIDATIRVLGIDVVCFGSDRPYAAPTEPGLGPAAAYAIAVRNPGRLLAHVVEEALV
jgi:Amidohydrolase